MEKNKIIENIIKKSQMKIAISELVKEENTVKKIIIFRDQLR